MNTLTSQSNSLSRRLAVLLLSLSLPLAGCRSSHAEDHKPEATAATATVAVAAAPAPTPTPAPTPAPAPADTGATAVSFGAGHAADDARTAVPVQRTWGTRTVCEREWRKACTAHCTARVTEHVRRGRVHVHETARCSSACAPHVTTVCKHLR